MLKMGEEHKETEGEESTIVVSEILEEILQNVIAMTNSRSFERHTVDKFVSTEILSIPGTSGDHGQEKIEYTIKEFLTEILDRPIIVKKLNLKSSQETALSDCSEINNELQYCTVKIVDQDLDYGMFVTLSKDNTERPSTSGCQQAVGQSDQSDVLRPLYRYVLFQVLYYDG